MTLYDSLKGQINFLCQLLTPTQGNAESTCREIKTGLILIYCLLTGSLHVCPIFQFWFSEVVQFLNFQLCLVKDKSFCLLIYCWSADTEAVYRLINDEWTKIYTTLTLHTHTVLSDWWLCNAARFLISCQICLHLFVFYSFGRCLVWYGRFRRL